MLWLRAVPQRDGGLLALAELKQAIEHLDADVIGILQPHIFAA